MDCTNEAEVKSYVEELRQSSNQVKAIVAPAEQTCFTSSGAALIKKARQLEDEVVLDERTDEAIEI